MKTEDKVYPKVDETINIYDEKTHEDFHEGYIDFLDEVCKPSKLSLDDLRRYNEYKLVSDEEGYNIIETLYTLSLIAYYSLKFNKQI